MPYLVRQSEVAGQAVDVLAEPETRLTSRSVQKPSAKWPFWWTVLGVTIICTMFWACIFAIVL